MGSILFVVILTVSVAILITIVVNSQVYDKRGKIKFESEDCQFSVGSTYYTVEPGDEIKIGENCTVVFSKDSLATIRISGDIKGDVISKSSDITINGNVSGNITSNTGDIIINGNTKDITTSSGNIIVNNKYEQDIKKP